MRRDMQEILPGLFLGPYGVAKDLDRLKTAKVSHIVTLRSVLESRMIVPRFSEVIFFVLFASLLNNTFGTNQHFAYEVVTVAGAGLLSGFPS